MKKRKILVTVLTFLIGKESNKEGIWKVSGPQIVFPIDASERATLKCTRWAFQLRCCLLVHLFFWARGRTVFSEALYILSFVHALFCFCIWSPRAHSSSFAGSHWPCKSASAHLQSQPHAALSACLRVEPCGWDVLCVVRTVTCPWLAALGPVLRHTWSDSGDILPEGLGLVKINCLEH